MGIIRVNGFERMKGAGVIPGVKNEVVGIGLCRK